MKRFLQTFFLLFLFLTPLYSPPTEAYAADIRSNEVVTVGPESRNLTNLYLFGNTITLSAPVQDDVVAAGKDVTLDGHVNGSIMAAGQDVTIRNTVSNSVRAAGSRVSIESNVLHDALAAGGDVILSKTASVGGDVLFAGGNVQINGPVKGNVRIAGGNVVVNSAVSGNVDAHVGTLTLGPQARIGGQLNYSAEKQAVIDPQARIAGKVSFDQRKDSRKETNNNSLVQGISYKLIVDIILSLLLIYFLRRYCLTVLEEMKKHPWKRGSLGFGFLFLFPLAAIAMLLLIWLGVAAFLFYGLVILLAMFVAKIFIGWVIMQWYERRSDKKRMYQLDWKAGVVGPIVMLLLSFVPVIGWLIGGILYLLAIGALLTFVAMKIRPREKTA